MDVTKIEGYENMTAEEKIAALEAYEPDLSGMVSKSVLDRATAEAADWKRKYNSTLSDAEKAKVAAEESQKAMNDRLAELERKDKISTAKDQYIASGFTPELASATAEAFVDGNMDLVFQNINKHAINVATAAKDEALKETPAPPASGNPQGVTIDYLKESEEAAANGNFALAAHYQRAYVEQKK